VEWLHLAQDRDKMWALVNMVVNLLVPYRMGNFFTTRATAIHGDGSQTLESSGLFQVGQSVWGGGDLNVTKLH
jgi:hypothetical protein